MIIPKFKVIDSPEYKALKSEEANWFFRKSDGFTAMWGRTHDEDMKMSPVPVILDMEITTKCAGPGGTPCPFCYKANGPVGDNMSFETFQNIIDKMPFVTQIAFGADAQGTSNPDLPKMMWYARSKGIVPNITIADIDNEMAKIIANYCGAVAVSCYDNHTFCYDAVSKLVNRGMKQVNIHFMICKERLSKLESLFTDIASGMLPGLNAVVLLSLKQKGRGKKGFTPLTQEEFNSVVAMAQRLDIPLGFDSCSARKFEKAIEGKPECEKLKELIVPCESTLESSYIDVYGNFYPCSFTEGSEGWEKGISVIEAEDFVKDVWYHERTQEFRNRLWGCDRHCPIYDI